MFRAASRRPVCCEHGVVCAPPPIPSAVEVAQGLTLVVGALQ